MKDGRELYREYSFLDIYLQDGFKIRKTLLRIQFNNLEELEKNRGIFSKYNDDDKNIIRSCIQVDLISKIMMLIEDLAIISESCKQKKGFYKLVDRSIDNVDLGNLIKKFFDDLENLTDNEIKKMFSYIEPSKLNADKHSIQFLKKYQKENIQSIKRMFTLISLFGKEHHPAFHRYKHAGIPINPGIKVDTKELRSKIDFKTFMGISKGNDPTLGSYIIPYSLESILSYKIIIAFIHQLLDEIIHHRMESISRGIEGVVPPRSFGPINVKGTKILKKLYDIMDNQFPVLQDPGPKQEIGCDQNDIQWYLTVLPMLLKGYAQIDKNNPKLRQFMIDEFNVKVTTSKI